MNAVRQAMMDDAALHLMRGAEAHRRGDLDVADFELKKARAYLDALMGCRCGQKIKPDETEKWVGDRPVCEGCQETV